MSPALDPHAPPPRGAADTPPRTVLGEAFASIRRRVFAGLLLVLPIVVTFWILYWLYNTLDTYIISPSARLIVRFGNARNGADELPPWFSDYGAPALGIVGALLLLYFLGFFARSRIVRLVDGLLLRLPVVTTIYGGVSKVFQSFGGQGELTRFQRVVLVSFPHPGMRVPGFVTTSCKDAATGKTILCVYVPTTPIPSSGYMLLIPEEEVTDLDWSLEETVQAVVSFGITAPDHVRYHREPLPQNESQGN
jgi:uncharacterized membrane protein